MPTLAVDNFNIVCATLGGFITVFGLVSYLLKEKYYLSEALISTIFGLIFSPHATNWVRPLEYAFGDPLNLETITLYFSRLVLGVQLVLAGVQLPSKYLWTEWRSLAILLGPGMCIMWMSTSLIIWALVPDIPILYALATGACVTPTDPVLSNSIVKGKFADKNIPPALQKIIIAESGANDGLGYPFLFLALYLLKYTHDGGLGASGNGGTAIGLWFGETWGYEILLSIVYGAVVGWLAKELLHWAEERHYVDRESFLVFAITLALFIVGTVGMFGSDDVLACFIAGNAFTWDDWFRLETEDDSLQPTIDMLLNVSIFMWFGAVCPWHIFVSNSVIPIYRLIPLGIMVLLFRRLPMLLAFHKFIHQVEDFRHALFVGFFGPIGVSAVFYLYISTEFLRTIEVNGVEREDAARCAEVIEVVVWFLIICSIVVHGLSIPLGKLGLYLPRTISEAFSSERASRTQTRAQADSNEPEPFHVRRQALHETRILEHAFRRRRPTTSERGPAANADSNMIWRILSRIGRSIRGDLSSNPANDPNSDTRIEQRNNASAPDSNDIGGGNRPEISKPINPRIIGKPVNTVHVARPSSGNGRPVDGLSPPASPVASHSDIEMVSAEKPTVNRALNRSIRFPDEPSHTATADRRSQKSQDDDQKSGSRSS